MNIDLSERYASVAHVAQYFSYDHLPPGQLRRVSAQCSQLAEWMLAELPDGAELTVGLRKLLEAKDCFVRTALPEAAYGDESFS